MNFELSRGTLNRARGKMNKLQEQASSTRRLLTPSDDPVGAAKVLEIRTDRVNNDQFLMNARMAETFLNNTEGAVSEMSEIVMRAKEIALGQSSGASATPQTRVAVAQEVTQLYQQAIAAANRRVGERYLLGGYKTTQPPFEANGQYRGDDGQILVEINKDVFLGMNVPGLDAVNTRPDALRRSPAPAEPEQQTLLGGRSPASLGQEFLGSRPQNVNLFDELQALRTGLLAGDDDAIRNTLDRFDDLQGKLVSVRAMLGSRVQGINNATQSIERMNVTNAGLSSSLEDADMAQVMSDLAREETVFRGALASSNKLIQPTLLDFLK